MGHPFLTVTRDIPDGIFEGVISFTPRDETVDPLVVLRQLRTALIEQLGFLVEPSLAPDLEGGE